MWDIVMVQWFIGNICNEDGINFAEIQLKFLKRYISYWGSFSTRCATISTESQKSSTK